MFRKYVLPLLSLAGLLFGVWMVIQAARPVPAADPVAEPAMSPYRDKISGSGILEASTRNIAVGAPTPGVIERLAVKVGDRVKAGDLLFAVDGRAQRAELAVRKAALAQASAALSRLLAAPRVEEVPPARASVREAEADLANLRQRLSVAEKVSDPRAVSREDLGSRRYEAAAGEARLARSRADLALLLAGSWKEDVAVARADVARAEAEVLAAQTELDRLEVRSPVDGEVLQLNVRLGEYAPSGEPVEPLALVGDIARLHVRVDIDENDAWRFRPEAPATAFVRGNPDISATLDYEYLEPYVIPKRSLTGDSVERVDTRVLQVVYSFAHDAMPVYAGQLVDVFIEDLSGGSSAHERGHEAMEAAKASGEAKEGQ